MIQIKKTILTLVALLAVTTGAWAETETLLTTITLGGSSTYSETTSGVVSVTATNVTTYDATYGWLWWENGSLSVTAEEGYTITRCVFIQQGKNQSVTISEAPFELNFEEFVCLENYSMDGVSSIEVYGTAPAPSGPEVAWDKTTKTGTFDMPGGNVELEPEYYPQAALTAEPTAINDVPATTDGAIVNAGTVANIGSTTTAQGTVMYYVSTTALDDAALLALAADAWTADVPTAQSFTAAGTAHVYYYVRGNDSDNDDEIFSDGDILATNALTVTIAAAPTYAVTFAEGTDPDEWTASPATNVTKGQPVTVTYTGTKKVIGVKAEKKAAAPAAVPVYYNKLTKINDVFMDQVNVLKQLGRGRQAYNSSLTAAQAYALATYQAAIDGKPVYVIMSSQDEGFSIHYAVSTDAAATEHTADLYNLCSESNTVRMYYVAQ